MLNNDIQKRVVLQTADLEWEASPSAGVWRKPLEKVAAESGRTSSLVRFDAGSEFRPHAHPLGEEILVLEGVFRDETADFPAGSYFRNPPGSAHTPSSPQGCTLLVKLDQFSPLDRAFVRINTLEASWSPGYGGLQVMPLHEFEGEHVALVKWPAGESFVEHQHFGGEEIFVISGELVDEHGRYPAGSWIRSPHGSRHHPYAEQDTLIWVKTGHLPPIY